MPKETVIIFIINSVMRKYLPGLITPRQSTISLGVIVCFRINMATSQWELLEAWEWELFP